MDIRDNFKDKKMVGTYGYCQIHNIKGLVKEVSMTQNTDKATHLYSLSS